VPKLLKVAVVQVQVGFFGGLNRRSPGYLAGLLAFCGCWVVVGGCVLVAGVFSGKWSFGFWREIEA